jgi:hypothetical protein
MAQNGVDYHNALTGKVEVRTLTFGKCFFVSTQKLAGIHHDEPQLFFRTEETKLRFNGI